MSIPMGRSAVNRSERDPMMTTDFKLALKTGVEVAKEMGLLAVTAVKDLAVCANAAFAGIQAVNARATPAERGHFFKNKKIAKEKP